MIGITGTKTAVVTSASCQEYTAMVRSVTTMIVPFTIHDIAPHWANWASVSMSLVTRVTRTPRLDSSWCAIESEWTWPNAFTRSAYSAACALSTRRR